ncbi:arylsulfatase [Persicitalea jodogahamensis]|uniref:N-acetylgalactosamine-6-sulfatase n=1 Tax=Persicitalea jodogahamensis TaxID=402147 RepID=A0A8J3DBE7_9BACT|nr:arylsulfatase [Persicitalea jodogahamensis]GHB79901.1 N-acetylgalactosamine-6-sulfatase [Persicitalea jodogahamensis]
MRFILLLLLLPAFLKAQNRKPNVVILLSDDQGWGDLSVSGNTNIHTPNIDGIAKNGALFDRFYVQPVCSPTRAELLTGRYHTRMGVRSTSEGGERFNLDETTIAQAFKSAGYATAAYGKWHSGMQYPYHPNARGFDDYYGFCSGHWGDYFSPMLEHNGAITEGKGFLVDDLTDHAMSFMEQNKDSPFFIYVPYNTPHAPMQVPDRWWDDYKNKPVALRAEDGLEEDLDFTRAALAMCENIDWNVGRIMEKLKELNLEDDTIVLYFSDNGPNSFRWNEGMKGRKGSTDEGGVRSPLVMQYPKMIKPGTKIREISGVIDLLPTLVDMANINFKPKKPLDGVSLKPLLSKKGSFNRNRLLYNYWNGNTSVRSQQYRLDSKGKLYDMIADPSQTTDISTRKPDVTARLREAATKWNAELLPGIHGEDERTFPVGHPDFRWTQLPARDAQPIGGIVRSNRWPNCSFFTNWTKPEDAIVWDVEVLADGDFEATIYYTCAPENVGSTFRLTFGNTNVLAKISEAFDPPLRGMENDRVERPESYVKDWKTLNIGKVHLEKGKGSLTLKAEKIAGKEVMDFRLLMLERSN